jgi:uncharacterized protein (DUF924 family)
MWFQSTPALDQQIQDTFAADIEAAMAGALAPSETAADYLAVTIILDQFPRNIFRNTARSFAYDPQALRVAQRAIDAGFDAQLPRVPRRFLYLPFEHSEDLAMQQRCVALLERISDDPDGAAALEWAVRHLRVIERFGRFPHRNQALGRDSTDAERAYLAEGKTF